MDQAIYKGTISFIHHDKQYATIEFEQNGKAKSVNFKTGKENQSKAGKTRNKSHRFRIGDAVNFQLKLSDRGDKMVADEVRFLYNTELEKLVNKAKIENRFSGYLKLVDDKLFVKEWDSYIFFPLTLSKWENPPAASAFNEAISFKLVNLDKPNAIAAELFSHDFFPEYRKALEHFKNKIPLEATVSKVSPFAVYLHLFGDRLQAKMDLPAERLTTIKTGDKMEVRISYISSNRIVVENA
jgi:hypothetical protein